MPKRNPFKLKEYQGLIINEYKDKLQGEIIGVAEKSVISLEDNGEFDVVVTNVNLTKKEIYPGSFMYFTYVVAVYVGDNALHSVIETEIDSYDLEEAKLFFRYILNK